MDDKIDNRLLFSLTVDEYRSLTKSIFYECLNVEKPVETKEEYIYSIQGLADFLHFSIVTAQKLKNSGKIPYQQIGRKVMFEKTAILKAMSKIQEKFK